jgi:hypothetical protein
MSDYRSVIDDEKPAANSDGASAQHIEWLFAEVAPKIA